MSELAERFGTPLYVYDLDAVARQRDALFSALPEGFELFYAVKANPHPDIGRVLSAGGCRAEISSTGELQAAIAGGFSPAECLYTGPGKTDAELEAALAAGVRMFSAESLDDLRHIGAAARRHGTVARCLLRVNTASAAASTGIRMMGRPSQFGIDSETLPDLMPALASVPGTRLVGAHFFTMSNAESEDALLAEYLHVVTTAAELGMPLEFLDIGGGFAAPYATGGEPARYEKLRTELEAMLDLHLPGWRAGSPRLACESGRYLVASCGRLLARVVNVKRSRGRTFVILDAGINVLGGLSGLGRLLPVAVRLDGEGATEVATLVGPLCTPGDTLGRDVQVPHLEPGDLVTVPNVGAYGPTASLLSFLGRPAPVEVAVRQGEIQSVTRLEYRRVEVA
ncbi:decarboxylase [Thermoactinospora rubra]|uniref:decarboxylase n=1 Tax=Thermoactinospora rubra TaxID=1088767 RepID=UPI000A11551C|nr:decarboxylase [Thermoactinospora rubra]